MSRLSSTALSLLCLYLPFSVLGDEDSSSSMLLQQNISTAPSNLRWSIDLSSRQILITENNTWSAQHVVGLDVHKVFTGHHGDWGTLLFQPYLVKLQDFPKTPFGFDDPDDLKLTWRMLNFNYTGINRGKFNIRVGHFEVPYGLEHYIDTAGTLRQFTIADRKIKTDWGITANGTLPSLEYEVAVSRGSGIDYSNDGDPYLISGRVGTPSTKNLVAGISFFQGKILEPAGAVNRKRLGLDLALYTGLYELLLEISVGTDEDLDRLSGFGEISFKTPMEDLHLYLQGRIAQHETIKDSDNASSASLGINWSVGQRLELSAQLTEQLESFASKKDASNFIAQIRYRF